MYYLMESIWYILAGATLFIYGYRTGFHKGIDTCNEHMLNYTKNKEPRVIKDKRWDALLKTRSKHVTSKNK